MTEVKNWMLATHNAGKIKEIRLLLAPLGVKIRSAAEMSLPEPEETEATFTGNAALKARAACAATGLTALADDSGLAVTALDGAPGIYSARWAGEPRDFNKAMARVHRELEDRAATDFSATFICVLALAHPDGSIEYHEGRIEGQIVWPPRGAGGFGYDPIFVPKGENRTFAQMSMEEKKTMSHRGRALQSLLAAESSK